MGGDLDGDGYGDLLLADGAADYGGYTDNGALWALFGQTTSYTTSSAENIEGTATVLASGSSTSDGNAWAVGLGGEVHFRRFTEYSVLKALPYEAQFFGRQRKTIEGARDQLAERVQRA